MSGTAIRIGPGRTGVPLAKCPGRVDSASVKLSGVLRVRNAPCVDGFPQRTGKSCREPPRRPPGECRAAFSFFVQVRRA